MRGGRLTDPLRLVQSSSGAAAALHECCAEAFVGRVGGMGADIAAVAFASRHAAVGIAMLVTFYVLPEFVLLPLRIRRSRRAAEVARARRTGSTGP